MRSTSMGHDSPTHVATSSRPRSISGVAVRSNLQQAFNKAWYDAASESSKLQFYRQVKVGDPCFEPYLNNSNRGIRKSVAQLRSSSHRLNIESSRHQQVKDRYLQSNCGIHNTAWLKCCKACCDANVSDLQQLPFPADPIVEDERHVLATCPAYHHLRSETNDHILSTLLAWDERLPTLFETPHIKELATLIHKILATRFPKTHGL